MSENLLFLSLLLNLRLMRKGNQHSRERILQTLSQKSVTMAKNHLKLRGHETQKVTNCMFDLKYKF